MDDAFVVRGFERARNLARDGESFVEWNGAFSDQAGQRGAFDQLHDEVIRADVVEVADVGMVQRGDGAGFTIEALGESFFGDFDGDFAAEARVVGAVDLAHPARAEIGQDFVGTEAGSRGQWHRGHTILSKPDRRKFVLWVRGAGGGRQFAAHGIQNPVDEMHRFLAREPARQFQRFVDHHRGRRVGAQHFIDRDAQDVPVDRGHALHSPVRGVARDQIVHRRDFFDDPAQQPLGEFIRAADWPTLSSLTSSES